MRKLRVLSALGLALLCGLAAAQEPHAVLRVNCGAAEQYVDGAGRTWLPDRSLVGNVRWGVVGGGTVLREGLQIEGTDAPGVYLHERYGVERYEFAVPDGRYSVRLHFAETWDGITGPGQRVFSVVVEGEPVLEEFDPFAAGGGLARPVVRTVEDVQVADGSLSVAFVPRVQSPEINGIEIIAHGVSREEAQQMAEELRSAGEGVEKVLEDVSLDAVELPEGSWGGMLPVAITYLMQQEGADVGFCELVAGSGWAFSFRYDYDRWHVAALGLDQFDWLPRRLGFEVPSVPFGDSAALWAMITEHIDAGEPVAATLGDGGLIKGYRVQEGRAQFLFEGEPASGWMDLGGGHPVDRCAVLRRTGTPVPERQIAYGAVLRAARIASPHVEGGAPRGMAALETYLADVEDPTKDFEDRSEWFCWATFERLAARKCCADRLHSAADVLGGDAAEALRAAAEHYERAFEAYHEYDRLVHENEGTGMSLQERLRTPERIAVLAGVLREGIEAERAGLAELNRAADMLRAAAEAAGRRAVLGGVPPYEFADPMFEALRVVMSHRGEDYSAAYVQGISGMAFRLAGPCPCAPTCSAPMDEPEVAALFGYEAEHLYLGDKQEDVDARLPELVACVKDELRAGRAVMVWHAFTDAEWDVVCGFDDALGPFYGRGSYPDMRGDEYVSAPQERMGGCLGISPAIGILVLGEKTGSLDARASELAALREAVRHGREPGHRLEATTPEQRANPRYRKGPDPYEWWIANPPTRGGYCLSVTRDRRQAAAEFMREIAPRYPDARQAMQEAAEHFAAEADALDAVAQLGHEEEMPPETRRERAAELLRRARAEYEAAIGSIEAALNRLGETQAESV
ncbi:MAG: malectin domain-containing carbohydrate-binding protein [Candidatus Brocadiia bacterium]